MEAYHGLTYRGHWIEVNGLYVNLDHITHVECVEEDVRGVKKLVLRAYLNQIIDSIPNYLAFEGDEIHSFVRKLRYMTHQNESI